HVDALAGVKLGRAHVIEEDERTDDAALRGGQRPAHREAAEVAGARDDHPLDRVARVGVAGEGVLAGKEAHGQTLLCDRGAGLTVRGVCCKRASIVRWAPSLMI